VLQKSGNNKTIVALLNDIIIKYCYARPQEKLGSAVYDTHRGYDIELNSLITSGRD